ncbi:major facilitator superfamily transporter [Thozetella sp. PMI_491]|nr:major facilitator superfamily transporter [Thozetella sp. PMI_491]
MATIVQPLTENVQRSHVTHVSPSEGKRTWKSYFWDSWDKSPEEQRLVLKLDLTLLTFGCLGTFIKYLDRSNINSAFVSGMKEDLGLYGNELNYANTAYAIANIIGLWPVNLALTRSNPKWFIPFLELGWTICTFAQSVMKTPLQMYAIRFILGLFETGHFSAISYLCGSWYRKEELGKRIAIVNIATAIGPMFSSYLQAAAYTGLNNVHGMKGWQWLFIIDGVISLGIIIPQCFFFPDTPARQKPDLVFTEAEIELARDRNPKEGRVKQGKFTKQQVRRWLMTPDIWLLWVLSVCNSIGSQPANSMAFWLKAWISIVPGSFTVDEINNYTTPIQAITVVWTLLFAWSSDTWLRGRRWPLICFAALLQGIISVSLAATPVFAVNKAPRWFLYYMSNTQQASSSMFWAWTQDTLSGDPATRAWASAGLNVWAWTCQATIPLGVFQTIDQPAVVSGNWTAAGFSFLAVFTALTLAWIQERPRPVRDDIDQPRTGDVVEASSEEEEAAAPKKTTVNVK